MTTTIPELLDKIIHNKKNFQDRTISIIEAFFERDLRNRAMPDLYQHHVPQGVHTKYIVPELLKRFENTKNTKITEFAINMLKSTIEKDEYLEYINLKNVFKSIIRTLQNQNKSIRDLGLSLLKAIYIRVSDNVDTILRELKSLKPILKKQIRSTLSATDKLSFADNYHIFPKNHSKHAIENYEESHETIAHQKLSQEELKVVDISNDMPQRQMSDSSKLDLSSVIPIDFDKLPYENQIMQKNKLIKELHHKLEEAYKANKVMSEENNYKVYNTLILMLEDSNVLVFLEAIKIVELLAKLKDKGIVGKYAKKFVSVLFDKFKETKTAVVSSIKNSLNALINNQIISIEGIVDILINIDTSNAVKSKKVIVSSSTNKAKNPKVK